MERYIIDGRMGKGNWEQYTLEYESHSWIEANKIIADLDSDPTWIGFEWRVVLQHGEY